MLTRFSANLGLLWTDSPLPEAIARAGAAGFGAVELQWPGDVPAAALRRACTEAGLPLLALNTPTGEAGAFGLAALPGPGFIFFAIITEIAVH